MVRDMKRRLTERKSKWLVKHKEATRLYMPHNKDLRLHCPPSLQPNIATCCPKWEMQPSYIQPRAARWMTWASSVYTQTPGSIVWKKGQWTNHSFLEKPSGLGCTRCFMHRILQSDQVSILLAPSPTSMTSDFTSLSLFPYLQNEYNTNLATLMGNIH